MTYGIDDGTTSFSTKTEAVYGKKNYSLYEYGNPWEKEIVGYESKTITNTEYKRMLNIDVYNVEQSDPVKVYEMKGVNFNTSKCKTIHVSHIETMLDGMFKQFPGENGLVITTLVTPEKKLQC